METNDFKLVKNEGTSRFEMAVEGQTAFVDYKENGNRILLIHTEVPQELSGQGIAGKLVEQVFRHIEAAGQVVVPYCPYVKRYLERHPEWNRLLG